MRLILIQNTPTVRPDCLLDENTTPMNLLALLLGSPLLVIASLAWVLRR